MVSTIAGGSGNVLSTGTFLLLDCVWHHLKLPLYPLYLDEIVGIAVASFFAVLLLIVLIPLIVYAVCLYNKDVINLKVDKVNLIYFVSMYMHIHIMS